MPCVIWVRAITHAQVSWAGCPLSSIWPSGWDVREGSGAVSVGSEDARPHYMLWVTKSAWRRPGVHRKPSALRRPSCSN